MPSIYVLRSAKNGKRYTGSTRKDVDIRLREHNSGSSNWTKQNRPFKIIYTEDFPSYAEALKREKIS